MIWILCVCVKNRATYKHFCPWKMGYRPPVADFFQISHLWGLGSNRPTEFCSNWPLLTLSNRCLNFVGQWQPCFLRYANVLIDICGTLDQDRIHNFHVDRANCCAVIAIFIFFYPLIAPLFFSCDLRLSSYISVLSLAKISHSVQEL